MTLPARPAAPPAPPAAPLRDTTSCSDLAAALPVVASIVTALATALVVYISRHRG